MWIKQASDPKENTDKCDSTFSVNFVQVKFRTEWSENQTGDDNLAEQIYTITTLLCSVCKVSKTAVLGQQNRWHDNTSLRSPFFFFAILWVTGRVAQCAQPGGTNCQHQGTPWSLGIWAPIRYRPGFWNSPSSSPMDRRCLLNGPLKIITRNGDVCAPKHVALK